MSPRLSVRCSKLLTSEDNQSCSTPSSNRFTTHWKSGCRSSPGAAEDPGVHERHLIVRQLLPRDSLAFGIGSPSIPSVAKSLVSLRHSTLSSRLCQG